MTHGTVLVVDDERAVRELVITALTRAGYRALGADTAERALELERTEPVDVLVTDVMLPRMHGPELAREICRRSPHTRVLYMSGYAGDSTLRPADLEGGHSFLQKPFAASAVVARVRELLNPPAA
jgi:two-component system, cell cycle sensor histidine kinase and response regulator CckA